MGVTALRLDDAWEHQQATANEGKIASHGGQPMSSRPRGPYGPGHYKAPQAPAHPGKPEHAKRDSYDWATFWVAVFGVGIVAVSAIIQAWAAILSQQQVAATREQIVVMTAQQRPWLSAANPNSGQIIFHRDDHSVLSYRMIVRNVGQATASEVRVQSEILGGDSTDPDTISRKVAELCARTDDPSGSLLTALFPGESADLGDIVGFNPSKTKSALATYEGKEYMTAIVVGCVGYRFYVDQKVRHTPFAFDVVRPDHEKRSDAYQFGEGRFYSAVPIVGGQNPDIAFVRTPVGAGSPD